MFTKTFSDQGDFEAWRAAQRWLMENGYSYGSTCVMHPVAVLKGEWCIAKWRNLTRKEIDELDGKVSGNFREGPVTVYLKVAP
ncbi:hypothetical protein [Pseudomonas sp. GV071]|uniref:hypothetical protein n=1 Tax=Pseudomonas sp. GV071 TaxID=2135754 RepID=UPI000D3B6CEB|nr:hypothetical protein [Pseudomonas sp. GV071]PTQ70387.1 hypothetical protein C8K61_106109 [Pseudomonas sp. GV071]